MTRRAFMYGEDEMFPPAFPWEPPQRVKSVRLLGDNLIEIVTDANTYALPGDQLVKMPMRPDGSTRVWGSETPQLQELAIGDFIDVNGKRWAVRDVYHIPQSPLTTVGVELHAPLTNEVMNCLGYAGQPFLPGAMQLRRSSRGESVEMREARPVRGPYVNKHAPDARHFFYVHPTGRGRWDSGIKPFVLHHEAGEFFSRPPAGQGKGSFKLWSQLEFAGDDPALRHPNDPRY